MAEPAVTVRPPVWRSARFRRALGQLAFVTLVGGFLYYLWFNLVTNMRRLGQSLDFSFLDDSAGIRIAGTGFRSSGTVMESLVVGVKNTLIVSAVGIVLAMVLGLIIGIARLSSNWLVRRSAAVYVETLRNIPVLVIIFFWSAAVILKLPRIDAPTAFSGVVLSNRGLWVPWFEDRGGFRAYALALVVGTVLAVVAGKWRARRSAKFGGAQHRFVWACGTFLVVAVGAYFVLGAPVGVSVPRGVGRAVRGGITLRPDYAALLAGLVVYTASHIAEIVRGSIQSVPRGQPEAAMAVGLSGPQRLRLVVLPQAFRVALPQLANQFLNLAKNSSLGIAVAYAELMTLAQINIANAAPAPQMIAILMVFYLAISLTVAAAAGLLDRRMSWAHR